MRYLFRGIDGFNYFSQKSQSVKQQIASLSSVELKSSDESLKIILKAQNTIEPISFAKEYTTDNGEVCINVRNDSRFMAHLFMDEDPRPVYKKARQLLVHLPFSGDVELFDVSPNSYSSGGYPTAEIEDSELQFTVEFFSDLDNPEKIQQTINQRIDFIKQYAGWLNGNIATFNDSIDPMIESELSLRRKKLSQDEEILGKLGVVAKPSAQVGFVKPQKKLNLKILESKEQQINPALEMETYNEIIQMVNSLGINLERSCERLRKSGEVPLRDTILGALNTFYAGMATGETFNRAGKADIILRYKDNNIYVAECKIWGTEDYFIEGIDQLLSYLTWRDTKTSYIIFSKNKEPKAVVEKSFKLMESNPHFITKIRKISDSSALYKLKNNSGGECFVGLHIFDLGGSSDI